MSQLSFFDSPREEVAPRSPNLEFIRKHLNAVLRLMRNAEHLPWSAAEAKNWQKQFPELTKLLPEDEAERYRSQFEQEWERLKAA